MPALSEFKGQRQLETSKPFGGIYFGANWGANETPGMA